MDGPRKGKVVLEDHPNRSEVMTGIEEDDGGGQNKEPMINETGVEKHKSQSNELTAIEDNNDKGSKKNIVTINETCMEEEVDEDQNKSNNNRIKLDEDRNNKDEEDIDDVTSDEEIYECACDKVFEDLEKYKKHKLKCKKVESDFEASESDCSDAENAPSACYACDQMYDHPEDLEKHKDICHPDNAGEDSNNVTEAANESGEPAEDNKMARTITVGWVNNKGKVVHENAVIFKKVTKCGECGDYLRGRTSYAVHKLKHENDKAGISFECQTCQESFQVEAELHLHENLVHCAKHLPFQCHHCDEKFSTFVATDSHMLYTHDDDGGRFPYRCYECSDVFTKRHKFIRHMATHTNKKLKKKFYCRECKKRFDNSTTYKQHMTDHTKYPCETCGKLYQKKSLSKHMKTHVDILQYECPICKKRFSQSSNRKIHMRTHSGTKPYECEICQESFAHKVSLKTHQKKAHNIDWWADNNVKKPKKSIKGTPIWKPMRKSSKSRKTKT